MANPQNQEQKKRQPCGACHVWGFDPHIHGGVCIDCERNVFDIKRAHGFVKLDPADKSEFAP